MKRDDFLRDCLGLTDEKLIRRMAVFAKIEEYEKGKLLIETGAVQTYLPFLIEGIFRGFLLDRDGQDITDCFAYHRGDAVMGCNELGEPSRISIEAVSRSKCLLLPVREVGRLLEECPESMQLYNRLLTEALERHWEEKMLMHRCTAMERYQWFLIHYPGLITSVSNKHIASFLGMTPVTLSRLRRQVRGLDVGEK